MTSTQEANTPHTAFIGLGTNLGDRLANLQAAVQALVRYGEIQAMSSVYETAPVGMEDQPAFLNAALQLATPLDPEALLLELLAIERSRGRNRTVVPTRGPRTLDLDLLHVDGVQLDDAQLSLPHPRMAQRAFVLLPLHDIAPTLHLPGYGRVDQLLATLDTAGCERLP